MKKLMTVVITAALVMCTAVSAFAADFTPSVTNPGKPAIENIGTETPSHGEDGNIIGYLTDAEGNILSTEYAGCVWIASLEEALDEDSEMSDNMRKLLKDLLKDFEDDKVDYSKIKGLEERVGKNPVVRDLFYAGTNCEILKEKLPEEGVCIELTLKANVKKYERFAVIVKIGDEWVLAEEVSVNEDGKVKVKLEDLGAIAFLVPGEEPVVTPPVEQEGGSFGWLAALAAVVLGGLGIGANKKKKSKQA